MQPPLPPHERLLSLGTLSVREMQLGGQGHGPAFPGAVLAETESEHLSTCRSDQ